MNTLAAPENKYLTQFENTEKRIIVQEVTGFGDIDRLYREATTEEYNEYIESGGVAYMSDLELVKQHIVNLESSIEDINTEVQRLGADWVQVSQCVLPTDELCTIDIPFETPANELLIYVRGTYNASSSPACKLFIYHPLNTLLKYGNNIPFGINYSNTRLHIRREQGAYWISYRSNNNFSTFQTSTSWATNPALQIGEVPLIHKIGIELTSAILAEYPRTLTIFAKY